MDLGHNLHDCKPLSAASGCVYVSRVQCNESTAICVFDPDRLGLDEQTSKRMNRVPWCWGRYPGADGPALTGDGPYHSDSTLSFMLALLSISLGTQRQSRRWGNRGSPRFFPT